jgi:1-deoxy-D-xylulose-5-phosphate reductoisomerase
MAKLQQVTILGATGTIGLQTLDVISQHPEKFSVFALTANSNVDTLFEQVRQFIPKYAVVLDEVAAELLSQRFQQSSISTEVLCGTAALELVSSHPEVDVVMAAIVGQ